jgi:hypothetical protein
MCKCNIPKVLQEIKSRIFAHLMGFLHLFLPDALLLF